jgi:hypothetical protein
MLVCALAAGSYRAFRPVNSSAQLQKKLRLLAEKGFSVAVYDEGVFAIHGPMHGLCGTGLQDSVEADVSPKPFTDGDFALFDGLGELNGIHFFDNTQVSLPALQTFHKQHPHCFLRATVDGAEIEFPAKDRLELAVELGP